MLSAFARGYCLCEVVREARSPYTEQSFQIPIPLLEEEQLLDTAEQICGRLGRTICWKPLLDISKLVEQKNFPIIWMDIRECIEDMCELM